jgi:hypothetical protein
MPLAVAALNIGVGPCRGEARGDMLEAMARGGSTSRSHRIAQFYAQRMSDF